MVPAPPDPVTFQIPTMDMQDAEQIFAGIKAASDEELKSALISSAIRYAQFRTGWAVSPAERRHEMDASRSRAHDAFIRDCDILSRAQARSGENNAWRTKLGHNRKEIGDLACFICLFLALSVR